MRALRVDLQAAASRIVEITPACTGAFDMIDAAHADYLGLTIQKTGKRLEPDREKPVKSLALIYRTSANSLSAGGKIPPSACSPLWPKLQHACGLGSFV